MRTCLVTGGAGFIGSNFIRYMLQSRSDVEIVNLDLLTYAGNLENLKDIKNNSRYCFVQGDIGDKILLERLFSEYTIDWVVNFAAESHVDRSIREPDVFVKTNILGTLALINAAKNAWLIGDDLYRGGCRFVQISTDEVYGSLGNEGFFTESTPLDPHSPYSASKASADLLVKSYFDTYRFPVNITRCSNNYGPYQHPEKLIPFMIIHALANKKLPVYGDGLQIRDWLHVEDHCRAIQLVMENGELGEVYNIGGHNEYTNVHIVKMIISFLQQNKDDTINNDLISFVTDRKGHDRRYAINPSKIINQLGWQQKIEFNEGIRKTVQWYLNNEEWLTCVLRNFPGYN